MLAKVFSAAVLGIDACKVDIEINCTGYGKDAIVSIVGLPDNVVKESRDRVRSAIESSGLPFPFGKTVVNLAPAGIKKEGASFDLPIALGILMANRIVKERHISGMLLIGELSLDGYVKPAKGVLSVSIMASSDNSLTGIIVPSDNAYEAAIASGNKPVYPISHLREAVDFLSGKTVLEPVPKPDLSKFFGAFRTDGPDFRDVKGQMYVKRAIEVAAAGGHNILMIGPPGAGKSMLARRIPGILPQMHINEALEITKTHSIAGLLPKNIPIVNARPFRAPHHTISDAGLLGGGTNPAPGEVTLAHNGVLFLDELPEFRRNVLESLRQPLESGDVTISRASGTCTFPANFMLVAAMNPCPCGYYGNALKECICSIRNVQNYRGRISGPLLDRIDIHVEVNPLNENELLKAPEGESSVQVRKKVSKAREIQLQRYSGKKYYSNSDMQPDDLQQYCVLNKDCSEYLKHSLKELKLSARAYDRILKVSRTIADLSEKDDIELSHICEAIQYRTLDKRLW